MGNITVHSGPPTSLSTHGRLRPIGPLSHPPAPARLPRAARLSLPSGGRLASRRRHHRHPPPLALWLTPAPNRGPRRSWPPSRRAPWPPGASLPSTYPPRHRRYKKPSPPPMALPTLAASGESNPLPTYPQPEEKEKGKRRRRTEAPRAAPPAAKPEPPARRSRTRGSLAHLRPLLPRLPLHRDVLLPLPAPPPSSSLRRTPPSPTPTLRPEATQVRTPPHLPSERHGLRAEAERSAPPRRRAAAGDAGHRARLGCHLLQVPPPSSTRAPPA
jgi:hypothetical protein